MKMKKDIIFGRAACRGFGRRAQFFSIGTFILIMVLLLIFSYSASFREKNENLQVQRLKTTVVSSFVEEFEQQYAPTILEAAAKPSLVAYFSYDATRLTYEQFATIMHDGQINNHVFSSLDKYKTQTTLKNVLSTLTFNEGLEYEFQYTVVDAVMIDQDTIRLVFEYNYKFSTDGSTWEKQGVRKDLLVDVYGIRHPVHGATIDNSWVIDSQSACLTTQMFTNAPSCVFNVQRPVLIPII